MTVLTAIREDIANTREQDPAAHGSLEVLLTYPGVHAVWSYRFAHRLWCRGHRLPARFLAAVTRVVTGVDIHPGARIGRRLFIDHAMGVVIGATAVIGDDVTLHHEVTLGRKTPRGRHDPGKRHPTLEDRVTVGAGAKILGDIVVGAGTVVGANAVLTESTPPNSLVLGARATIESLHRAVSALGS